MPPQAELAPYIGSRYFERTEEDHKRFFGRDREIDELIGLVLAHNVVLVYAASGAGKTSLLNAGVYPKLVEEGFEILPRGRLRVALPPGVVLGEDTNPYVLDLLCSLAPEADVASLRRRTIAEHLRALPRPEGMAGRVLVIDQAEELFTFTPEKDWQRHQKELFRELRDAIHEAPDLRVVIVTREDYLARFDDLAPLLPGELRVRFHLEPLGREAARQAVEGPLASTGSGRRFADGVADQLVENLSKVKLAPAPGAGATGSPEGVPGPYVEPVQLQIVCSALWRKLPEGVDVITAEHLKRYGDVEQTLEHFYEEAIEACILDTHCEKERLARWFGERLITPSDTRDQVFRGADETEGLPNTVVELLENKRLIHADERAGGRWYELAHDRLILPIRVVNERWAVEFDAARARLQRRRRARRIALFGAPLLASALVVSIFLLKMRAEERDLQDRAAAAEQERNLEGERARAREQALTQGRIEDLRARCKAGPCGDDTVRVFDSVTDYLWRQGKTGQLVTLLKGASELIPPNYAMPVPGSGRIARDPYESGVLRIAYHPDHPMDEWRMRHEWDQVARTLVEWWGLPAPPRIALETDERLSMSSIRITASPESCDVPPKSTPLSASVRMPGQEGRALISAKEIDKDPKLGGFFKEYSRSDGWTEYKDLTLGGPWWFVPAWTLPIWRVGGQPAVSHEAVLAIVVANELLTRPDLILGCAAVKVVLKHAAAVAPVSVEEALAARTLEGLRLDLIELVSKHHQSLSYLPTILDALANHAGVDTAQAAAAAAQEQTDLEGGDARLYGRWRTPVLFDARHHAPEGIFREIAESFPAAEQPIRVELGSAVEPKLVEGGLLREETLERLSGLRKDLYLKHGILAPPVRFRGVEGARSLRIEILNQSAGVPEAAAVEVSPDEAPDRLFSVLEERYRAYRAWWLTAERLSSSLADLRAGERAWITQHFSLTDLKRLARAIVADDGAREGADTLRDFPWLVRSLAFWIHVAPPDVTVKDLAQALRETQRARLRDPGGARRGLEDRGTSDLRRGLDALDAGRMDEAAARFAAAIRIDRAGAITGFLRLYPGRSALAPDRRGPYLTEKCRQPPRGGGAAAPSASIAYEVQDLLDTGTALTTGDRRELELCILWSVEVEDRPLEARRRASALVTAAPVETWTRDEAFFLVRRWLISHRQEAAPQPAELSVIRQLLARSLADLPADKLQPSWKLLGDSLGARPWRWARELIAEVARELPPGWPSLKLELAYWLAGFGEDEAKQALALVDAIEPGRTDEQRWTRAWVRAAILIHLGDYGPPEQRAPWLDQAIAALRALAQDPATTPAGAGHVFARLADVHVRKGDVANARAAIRDGIQRSNAPGLFDAQRFFIELGEGDVLRAGAIAGGMVRRAPEDIGTLYSNAIFATLTRRSGFEDTARNFIFHDRKNPHEYVDYLRLMLSWALAQDGRPADAKQLLDERMKEIDRETWKQRLDQRDTMVWREMLVAYSAGAIPASEIFDPLRDEPTFRASPLSQTELSLNGLRCEAYFYAALREHVTGDPATREARFLDKLNRAIALEEHGYFEHRMARFLISRSRS